MTIKVTKVYTRRKSEKKLFLTMVVLAFLIIFIGCSGKEKEIPGMNIAGIRATIIKILISPLAFDGAIVAVEGLAHDVKKEISNGEDKVVTIFKLSDLRGNFINVSIPGTWEILENDHLIVGGIYRRAKNEIEAEQIEKILLEKKDE